MITAALSIQDPRERPVEHRARADQLHARFRDPRSDFMAWLNLWRHLRTQQKEMGSSAFRRMCREEHLNYLRVREWQDFESQLRQVAKQVGLKPGAPADVPDADGIHQALLSGLLSHIGLRDPDRRDYLGARGTRFAIFPGSGLFKSQPDLVMAAELVETSRLWGRQNAAIDPLWAERLGGDLVKRTWSEPYWSKKRESALGPRAGHAVRRPAGRRPRRTPRPAPARRRARAVHPARAGAGGVAGAAPVLRDQPAAARGGGRARAPRPPPRHRGRRGDALRLLRRAGPGRGRLRRPLRHLVEAGAAYAAGPAHLRPGDARARGRGSRRGRLPRRVARGTADLAAELPLRTGSRGRRRHHRRAARHPEHRRRRRRSPGTSPACGTSW